MHSKGMPKNIAWKKVARTVFQMIVTLAVLIPVFSEWLQENHLLDGYPRILAFVATAGVVAGALARFMALPAVDAVLGKIGLNSAVPPSPPAE